MHAPRQHNWRLHSHRRLPLADLQSTAQNHEHQRNWTVFICGKHYFHVIIIFIFNALGFFSDRSCCLFLSTNICDKGGTSKSIVCCALAGAELTHEANKTNKRSNDEKLKITPTPTPTPTNVTTDSRSSFVFSLDDGSNTLSKIDGGKCICRKSHVVIATVISGKTVRAIKSCFYYDLIFSVWVLSICGRVRRMERANMYVKRFIFWLFVVLIIVCF